MLLGGDVAPPLPELLAEALEFLLTPSGVLVVGVGTAFGGRLLPFRILGLQLLAGLDVHLAKKVVVGCHGTLGFLAALSSLLGGLLSLLAGRGALGGFLLAGLHVNGKQTRLRFNDFACNTTVSFVDYDAF